MGTNSYFFVASSDDRKLVLDVTKDLEVLMFTLRARPIEGILYDRLVFVEEFTSMVAAQARLNQFKRFSPKKRQSLVAFANPQWRDLTQELFPSVASMAPLSFEEWMEDDDGDSAGGVAARVPAGPSQPPRSAREAKAWPSETEASSAAWP